MARLSIALCAAAAIGATLSGCGQRAPTAFPWSDFDDAWMAKNVTSISPLFADNAKVVLYNTNNKTAGAIEFDGRGQIEDFYTQLFFAMTDMTDVAPLLAEEDANGGLRQWNQVMQVWRSPNNGFDFATSTYWYDDKVEKQIFRQNMVVTSTNEIVNNAMSAAECKTTRAQGISMPECQAKKVKVDTMKWIAEEFSMLR